MTSVGEGRARWDGSEVDDKTRLGVPSRDGRRTDDTGVKLISQEILFDTFRHRKPF